MYVDQLREVSWSYSIGNIPGKPCAQAGLRAEGGVGSMSRLLGFISIQMGVIIAPNSRVVSKFLGQLDS